MDAIAAGRSLRDEKPVTYTFGTCHIALLVDFLPCVMLLDYFLESFSGMINFMSHDTCQISLMLPPYPISVYSLYVDKK